MNVAAYPASYWWDRNRTGWGGWGGLVGLGASTQDTNHLWIQDCNGNLIDCQDPNNFWNGMCWGNGKMACLWGCCGTVVGTGPTVRQATSMPSPTQTIPQGQPGASFTMSGPPGTAPSCDSCTAWQQANATDTGPDSNNPGNEIWYFPQDPTATMASLQKQATTYLQNQPTTYTGDGGTCEPSCSWPQSWLPISWGGCTPCAGANAPSGAQWMWIIGVGVVLLLLVGGVGGAAVARR